MPTMILFLVLIAAASAAYVLLRRMDQHRRSLDRLYHEDAEGAGAPEPVQDPVAHGGPLQRWLFLAGYRGPGVVQSWLFAILLCTGIGAGIVLLIYLSGVFGLLLRGAALIPGAIGQVLVPIAHLMPWVLGAMVVSMPAVMVHRARRGRIQLFEQDLPVTLDLLATLSEAGLGFDAALVRVLETDLAERPLGREFRSFQSDLLAGRARVEALRRLARRIEVASITILVSALVQTEQLGMGFADVLRRQADDLRSRRRERANAFAMALPVKRLFPMVICFLPGIFIWTLGPFFAQLFQFIDTFTQLRNF